ncbi:hypothetical protein JHK85_004162 [Glycine max]|nr:hypothetical protein JHK85_004162 [Glycine max]
MEDMAEMLEKQLASEVRKGGNMVLAAKSCDDIFNNLLQDGVSPDELYKTVFKQEVEIVLTAHPTQINHRTLQYKHLKIAVGEKTSIWQTDELRRSKPTPVDEARAEGNDEEDHHEHWNGSMSRSQSKHPNQQASPLPTKLPAGAHIPSCAWPGMMPIADCMNK